MTSPIFDILIYRNGNFMWFNLRPILQRLMWGFKWITEKHLVYWHTHRRHPMYHCSCYDYYYWDNILRRSHCEKYKTLLRFWVNTDNNIPLPKDPVYLSKHQPRSKQSSNHWTSRCWENIPGFACFPAPCRIQFFFVCISKCHNETIVNKRIRGDFSFHLLWGSDLKHKEGPSKINFIILRNNHWNSHCEYIHYYTMPSAVHQCAQHLSAH